MRSANRQKLKTLRFSDAATRDLCLACLSSSLFYWFNIVNSDCRNLNKREVISFPVPDDVPKTELDKLSSLLAKVMESYQNNSTMRTVNYAGKGDITVQYFNFRPAKGLLDELDAVLLPLYGLSESQRDFIVNYEVKYRLGVGSGDDAVAGD